MQVDGMVEQRRRLGDLLMTPARAILVGHQHHLTGIVEASVATSMRGQRERQQPGALGLVGHQHRAASERAGPFRARSWRASSCPPASGARW
jgi:hypothetical protein